MDWTMGEADMKREFTSTENPFFVLHDSRGFKPGDDIESFEVVREFIIQRRNKSIPLKDRLDAVW